MKPQITQKSPSRSPDNKVSQMTKSTQPSNELDPTLRPVDLQEETDEQLRAFNRRVEMGLEEIQCRRTARPKSSKWKIRPIRWWPSLSPREEGLQQ